jgi:hypothetical protein
MKAPSIPPTTIKDTPTAPKNPAMPMLPPIKAPIKPPINRPLIVCLYSTGLSILSIASVTVAFFNAFLP